jgi:DHA1 family bicyclomycin/chloramphenicol resistance-like MFS transporter
MARDFGTDYATVQLTVSVYLVANAVVQLIVGPLSDRYGRRPVMIGAFTIFVLATLAGMFATSITVLLVLRAVQASAAAGVALSRAIVRDMVHADEAASRIGYITMGMTVVPMVGPVIGGLLDAPLGWHGSWLVMLVVGAGALAAIIFDLGETNHKPAATFSAQFRAWPRLLTSSRFWGYAVSAGFTAGCYFAFLGGGPQVASRTLAMSPSAFGANLAFIGLGYMTGNFISGRYALLGVGNGLTLPSAAAGMVSARPDLAGSAAGLGGAIQISASAILSMIAGWVVGSHGNPAPLLILMLAATAIAIGFAFMARLEPRTP